MKIAIVGTRGIPNNYGGFEQCAQYLSVELVKRGHEVIVYNPHFHSYKEDYYQGVQIVRKYSPEKYAGAAANFIYDYLCLKDAINRKSEIILSLGYTSSAMSYKLLNFSETILITNMDGLEWKRNKFSNAVKKFLFQQEQIAVEHSHYMVADNLGILKYLAMKYDRNSYYIPYGAEVFKDSDVSVISQYGVEENRYSMLIARLERENNIEMILDGYFASNCQDPFLVVGNHKTPYGTFLKEKYKSRPGIRFMGGIYNYNHLCNLRQYCTYYFHGHSVGGTNPSLLEAMASMAFTVSHRNEFNQSVLGSDALYFSSPEDVTKQLESPGVPQEMREIFRKNNLAKIDEIYNWVKICDQYEDLFLFALKKKRSSEKKVKITFDEMRNRPQLVPMEIQDAKGLSQELKDLLSKRTTGKIG